MKIQIWSDRLNTSVLILVVIIAGIAILAVANFIPSNFRGIQYVVAQPSLTKDPNLKVESIVSGLNKGLGL